MFNQTIIHTKKLLQILIISLLIIVQGVNLLAQNLVPNQSFEQYDSCPDSYYQTNRLVGWEININSSDYFNSCANQITGVSVPNNSAGFQYAATGGAYCGFYGYTRTITTHNDAREFIGCQLSSPLIINQKYYVSLEVNLIDNANCGINKIGVLFITTNNFGDTLIQQPPPLINNFAQIYTDSIISDSTKWSIIRGSFIADSTYNYLLIGNFFDTSNFDSVLFAGNKCVAYYYVDNVCVSTDSLTCFMQNNILENIFADKIDFFPNPVNNFLNIKSNIPFAKPISISIYSVYGVLIEQSNHIKEPEIINLSDFSNGIYIIKIYSENKSFYKKIIINH